MTTQFRRWRRSGTESRRRERLKEKKKRGFLSQRSAMVEFPWGSGANKERKGGKICKPKT